MACVRGTVIVVVIGRTNPVVVRILAHNPVSDQACEVILDAGCMVETRRDGSLGEGGNIHPPRMLARSMVKMGEAAGELTTNCRLNQSPCLSVPRCCTTAHNKTVYLKLQQERFAAIGVEAEAPQAFCGAYG